MGERASQFEQAPYVSLATYRRSGDAVRTPVWIAGQGAIHYVFSAGDAGKVKRLQNSDRVQVAVCDVRGRVLGPWHEAQGTLITERNEVREALAALRRKYGWQMWLADAGAKLTGRFRRRAYIRVELTGD